MNDQPENKNHKLDQDLSDFTDQVYSGNAQVKPEIEDPESELARLEGTVLRIQDSLGMKEVDPVSKQRIYRRLVSEWDKAGFGKPAWETRRAPARRRSRWIDSRFALAQLGFALALTAVVILLLLPEVGPGILVASSKVPGLLPLAALVVIAVVAAVIYFTRRK